MYYLYFILASSDRKTGSAGSFGKQEEGWDIDEWNDTDKGRKHL